MQVEIVDQTRPQYGSEDSTILQIQRSKPYHGKYFVLCTFVNQLFLSKVSTNCKVSISKKYLGKIKKFRLITSCSNSSDVGDITLNGY